MHTGPIPAVVSAEVTLNLVIGGDYAIPVLATFHYSAHEPLSVIADFASGDVAVQWIFARDLLDSGLQQPTGHGDVTCWPAVSSGQQVVCIALRSPSGEALLEAPAEEIAGFLARSYEVVPQGSEMDHVDIDGLIEDLLADRR
ncbi:MAG: SsgA family sporulation/cell division regulator [Actinobacteria bacterium]|nr:SsgA family sporulation/cell division regulator [Actinomycetota bacterium]MCB8996043.1 SsgA family sporulation/cell division regulator [Actinomycetota bacterium]MCB9424440.1 SsgA family sporulation/cell division regulator [Actinomycetota bacterium]HRY08408.1 SsgA family sporulation/cell division regulator [Candidatus Nanopelagicales bacterium]